MTGIWLIALTSGVFAVILGGLWWVRRRTRGRRIAGSAVGPFEELWHPAAHRARLQVEIQDQRVVPGPQPGDPPVGLG